MERDEHVGQLLTGDGVTPVRFLRDGAGWTNADPVVMRVGDVLELGPIALVLEPPEVLELP